jgi:uncharacterized phage infection (PIP) family protein YhgE
MIIVAGASILAIFQPALTGRVAVDALPFPLPNNQAHITDGVIFLTAFLVVLIIIGILIGSPRTGRKNKKKTKAKKEK